MRFLLLFLLFLSACHQKPKVLVYGDNSKAPGWVSVFQTVTTDSESTINILRPHLTEVAYVVEGAEQTLELRWDRQQKAEEVIKTTKGPHIHWAVDRIHVKNLQPGKTYRLKIINKRKRKVIDWREFKALDLAKKKARFIVGSCMSDSHAFEHVRSQIWDQMFEHQADFVMLLGDEVYVDDFDFVKRQKANEFDIWTRYIDSLRKIPLFNRRQLIPVLAVWDDHDYGTNNSDKNFKSKKAAEKIFNAFFGGESVPGHYHRASQGVYFSFSGFGQNFLFMDDRYYREPQGASPFGHWGQKQHRWLQSQLKQAKGPVWLANGDQFFAKATYVTRRNGSKKQVNETFIDDHPAHFKTLMADLKKASEPVVFLSGDIHYSEIAAVEKELLGYSTYEITSSPVHSYIFRSKPGKPESWLDNPRRLISVKEHNYLLVDSELVDQKLEILVQSYGVKQKGPYFKKQLTVTK